MLFGAGATLSILNPTSLKDTLPQSTEKVQMVEVSNTAMKVSKPPPCLLR